ncbi:MAG TPA: alpha/beta fold hydrolase, partial [Kiloniellaceae bacterium]|nr:alpha/beta fold hydrolase [Kiloniellaceae bacterium]
MSVLRRLIGAAAALLAGLALWQLESSRHGLSMTALKAGETPASVYRLPDAKGPAVIIAHGFAGSRQLMEAYALTLAHAGYVAVSFDFPGHGRNPKPMTGDVTRIEGTTRQLVAETAAVIDAAVALDAVEGPVVLLGHSMATDILVRQAAADSRVAVVVAVSMYSEAVTAEQPARLLMISGAWERHLRAVALETLRLVDPQAGEGETAVSGDGTV